MSLRGSIYFVKTDSYLKKYEIVLILAAFGQKMQFYFLFYRFFNSTSEPPMLDGMRGSENFQRKL